MKINKFGLVIISSAEHQALLNQQYISGYKAGYEIGKVDGFMSKITPNEIRKTLGLEPLKEENNYDTYRAAE